jgi:hypothetical protein
VLFAADGKQIKRVPDAAEFKRAVRLLGANRAKAIRRELNRIIGDLPPDKETGKRTFSSAQLATQLEPWPYPLAGLYDIALEIDGHDATGRQVYDRAGLIFGLFIWECIMTRKERWVMDDPGGDPLVRGSSSSDPAREITEKVYSERRPA